MVDWGVVVNIMSMTTFKNLGKGIDDLIKTNVVLKDFGGNKLIYGREGLKCWGKSILLYVDTGC
jgi:hypothetical protein